MEIGPFAIRLVVLPVADINVTVGMDNPPKALLAIIDEVAIVPGTVRPDLSAATMTDRPRPLSRVFDVIVYQLLWLLDNPEPLPLQQLLAELVVPVKLEQLFKFLRHDHIVVVGVLLRLVV